MFGLMMGGIPLTMYQQMQKDYPGGKGLFGIMQLAKKQYQEDQRLFREAERAEGEAGTVGYSFMGEMESEPEPEPEPEPEQKFGFGFGGVYGGAGMKNITPFQRNRMMAQQRAYDKTTGGDADFQAWLASKYGNNN